VRLSVCSSAWVSALAGITWTTAAAGPLLPRWLLPLRSRMGPVLQRRTLLLRGNPQFRIVPCFLVYPTTRNQRKAARGAVRATPAGNTSLTAWVQRHRKFDGGDRMPSDRRSLSPRPGASGFVSHHSQTLRAAPPPAVSAHRAHDQQSGTGAAISTCGEVGSGYQPAADNNEATEPQPRSLAIGAMSRSKTRVYQVGDQGHASEVAGPAISERPKNKCPPTSFYKPPAPPCSGVRGIY
jgi:hypothetical protein